MHQYDTVCAYICICVNVCVVFLYVYIYVYMCTCVCTCLYKSVGVHVFLCICVVGSVVVCACTHMLCGELGCNASTWGISTYSSWEIMFAGFSRLLALSTIIPVTLLEVRELSQTPSV